MRFLASHPLIRFQNLEILLLVVMVIMGFCEANSLRQGIGPHSHIAADEDFADSDYGGVEPEWLLPMTKKASYFGRRLRDPVLTGGGPVMELLPSGSQDLDQLRKTVRIWEAKLSRFADKFADHNEALLNNPVWQKLVRIRGSLAQLLQSAEERKSLDETRM